MPFLPFEPAPLGGAAERMLDRRLERRGSHLRKGSKGKSVPGYCEKLAGADGRSDEEQEVLAAIRESLFPTETSPTP